MVFANTKKSGVHQLYWRGKILTEARSKIFCVNVHRVRVQMKPTILAFLAFHALRAHGLNDTVLVYHQKEMLEQLYNYTGGSVHWRSKKRWLSGMPCTQSWYGTSCDGKWVNEFDLSGNDLTTTAGALQASLMSHLGHLTSLTKMDFSDNSLSGTLPSQLGKLTKLTYFSFDANAGTHGQLPTELGNLVNMDNNLFLGVLGLTGTIPSQLGRLALLSSKFWLENNNLQGAIPTELGKLTGMKKIFRVSINKLSSQIPTQLGDMTAVDFYFALHQNSLTGEIPSQMGKLTAIRQDWYVRENSLGGQLPTELGRFTRITSFFSTRSNSFTGTLPTEIGQVVSLRNELEWNQNSLSGQIPTELGLLSVLTSSFQLHENLLTRSVPSELGKLGRASSLKMGFRLNSNQLSGQLPSQLGLLSLLTESIDLTENEFCGSVPSELGNLTSFQDWIYTTGNDVGTPCDQDDDGIIKDADDSLLESYSTVLQIPIWIIITIGALLCLCLNQRIRRACVCRETSEAQVDLDSFPTSNPMTMDIDAETTKTTRSSISDVIRESTVVSFLELQADQQRWLVVAFTVVFATLVTIIILNTLDSELSIIYIFVIISSILMFAVILTWTTILSDQPFVSRVPRSFYFGNMVVAAYDAVVDAIFAAGIGAIPSLIYLVVPWCFNGLALYSIIQHEKQAKNVDTKLYVQQRWYYTFLVLCGLSDPNMMIMFAWKEMPYLDYHPSRYSYKWNGFACLVESLCQVAFQLYYIFGPHAEGAIQLGAAAALCGTLLSIMISGVFNFLSSLVVSEEDLLRRSESLFRDSHGASPMKDVNKDPEAELPRKASAPDPVEKTNV